MSTRRRLRLAALVALFSVSTRVVSAQPTAVRFPIMRIGDSTFTFSTDQRGWVSRGQNGIAVDPRRRDALVARFRVLTVDHGLATALITGSTEPLSDEHVALIDQPKKIFFKQASFWVGALAGAAIGAFVATR
jgi:hypothetical protein